VIVDAVVVPITGPTMIVAPTPTWIIPRTTIPTRAIADDVATTDVDFVSDIDVAIVPRSVDDRSIDIGPISTDDRSIPNFGPIWAIDDARTITAKAGPATLAWRPNPANAGSVTT
jgi:hypothetical protein